MTDRTNVVEPADWRLAAAEAAKRLAQAAGVLAAAVDDRRFPVEPAAARAVAAFAALNADTLEGWLGAAALGARQAGWTPGRQPAE